MTLSNPFTRVIQREQAVYIGDHSGMNQSKW